MMVMISMRRESVEEAWLRSLASQGGEARRRAPPRGCRGRGVVLREKRWYGELKVMVPVSVTASERCGGEALLAHGGTARPHDRGLVNAAAAARAHVLTRMGRA